ncbi:conserved hypothetical protein [Altererythrobacter sp. B11]|nr:conserved hypothetical protein [Altererythrobacter sp. B11]
MRWVDWIWHVRGSLPLAPGLTADEAFDRLDPFFQERGTTAERQDDALVFHKEAQAPQDKMSIFDDGLLKVEQGPTGPVLRYHLVSRALLYCFLAPLLFLAVARFTVIVGEYEAASAEASEKSQKNKKDEEDPAEKYAKIPLNPIDKFLGAPAPEAPKKDKKDGKEKERGRSPTSAYVFAGIFAFLYLVGRILEDRLVRSRFRKRLQGAA